MTVGALKVKERGNLNLGPYSKVKTFFVKALL